MNLPGALQDDADLRSPVLLEVVSRREDIRQQTAVLTKAPRREPSAGRRPAPSKAPGRSEVRGQGKCPDASAFDLARRRRDFLHGASKRLDSRVTKKVHFQQHPRPSSCVSWGSGRRRGEVVLLDRNTDGGRLETQHSLEVLTTSTTTTLRQRQPWTSGWRGPSLNLPLAPLPCERPSPESPPPKRSWETELGRRQCCDRWQRLEKEILRSILDEHILRSFSSSFFHPRCTFHRQLAYIVLRGRDSPDFNRFSAIFHELQ